MGFRSEDGGQDQNSIAHRYTTMTSPTELHFYRIEPDITNLT